MAKIRSILLVDDDSDSAFLLKRDLARAFPLAVIREAPSCAVLQLISVAAPDLLVSAYRLRGITGSEFITQIRQTGSRFPVAMVSSMSPYRAAAMRAGADLFLTHEEAKQIPSQLLALFEQGLRESNPRREDVSNLNDEGRQVSKVLHPDLTFTSDFQ